MAKQFTRKVTEKTVYDGNAVVIGRGVLNEDIVSHKWQTIGGSKSETISGSKSENIDGMKSETILGGKSEIIVGSKLENVSTFKTENIGQNKNENIGGDKNESILVNKTENIGGSKTENIVGKKIVNVPAMEFPALGNYASDAAATAGGVLVGELYFNSSEGILKKRIGSAGIFNLTESGIFTLAADGMSATINGVNAGANLINPGANPTLRIPTTNKLKLGFFTAWEIANVIYFSKGESNGVIQNCVVEDQVAQAIFDTLSFYVFNFNNGWGAEFLLAGITNTTFDITFTQVGIGLAIKGQWHGIIG